MKRLGLILIVAALVFWMVNPTVFNSLTQKISREFQTEIKKHSRRILAQLKNKAAATLQKKGQAILGEAIGLKPSAAPEIVIVKNLPDNRQQALVLIDYLTQKDLTLSFKAGEVYYLDLRNVPKNNCLYINEESYAPKNNEFIKVSFAQNGKYELFFELCKREKTKFGEIIVE